MAIQVSSIAELEKVMIDKVREAMYDTEVNMAETISERINENVYQAYRPKFYNRTYSLRSSLNTGTYDVSATKIRSYINHDPHYASWYSVKDGEKFDEVPYVVSFGRAGTFVGEGYDGEFHTLVPSGAWGRPRYYMYMTDREYMNALSWHLPSSVTVHY